jgi:hypothetical protein
VEREEERRRLELGFLRAADAAMAESRKEGQREWERKVAKKKGEGFYGVLEAQRRVAE